MSPDNANMIPSWIRDEPPSIEECQEAAEAVLEQGYVSTTVFGEAPPVDDHQLSTQPGIVSGPS